MKNFKVVSPFGESPTTTQTLNTPIDTLYISMLLNSEELPAEARDHFLTDEWKDAKEFHISGDLLVIYMITDETLQLLRIGTHSQLFK